MAAGILPKPGTKYGPCRKLCLHRDCNSIKLDARAKCHICSKPIGYNVRFYREDDGRLVHALCIELQVEQEQATQRVLA